VRERALDVLKSWTYFERLRAKQKAAGPVTAAVTASQDGTLSGESSKPTGRAPIE
jgi:hypothetical protein